MQGYLQFLVDSRAVYAALEAAVAADDDLASLRGTGLERVEALDRDITWVAASQTPPLAVPPVGEAGAAYAALLGRLAAAGDRPRFLNHFYNHYFAHSAGGRMIGKRVSAAVLGGVELEFYKWGGSGEKPMALLAQATEAIDSVAAGFTEAEQAACLDETAAAFAQGGALMRAITAT